jgi:hypothetical protein
MRATLVRALCFFPAVGLLIPLASLEAQLELGQWVRITAPQLGISKYSGTLVALDGDMLTVGTLRVALVDVTRLDVYMGRKRNAGTGAVVGALVLGVPFTIFAVGLCESFSGLASSNCDVVGVAMRGLLIGGAAGALLGAGVGSLIKSDRWEEVPLDQLRVSLGPRCDGRFGLGLSVRF